MGSKGFLRVTVGAACLLKLIGRLLSPPKISLADDEAARAGMRMLVEPHDGWKVCAEVDNGHAGIEKTKELKPDLVILDILMPVLNGFAAAKVIGDLYPDVLILVFSAYDPPPKYCHAETTAPADKTIT